MDEANKVRGNPKRQLLEKLRAFEQACEDLIAQRTHERRQESLTILRQATEQLREHLLQHLAPKEWAEWREMPDSEMEIAAFASELKTEHADLERELGDLLRQIDGYGDALDRHEAVTRIWSTSKTLATRIARHAAGEEAELGRYTA